MRQNSKKIKFLLPAKGIFYSNGPSDPLSFYYKPIIGLAYKRRIQAGLNLLFPPYERILEFGYGSGLLLPTLALISENLSGIDIDADPEKTINSLKKLNITADLCQADIDKANYPSNSFDLIVAFSVFEHIHNPEPIIKEMVRILKPGGQLLVGMPRVDKFMARLFEFIGFPKINQHHVTSHQDFCEAAAKYFQLIKYSKMPSFLPGFATLYFNMLFKKNDRKS